MERFVKVGRVSLSLKLITLDRDYTIIDIRHKLRDIYGSCILYTKNGKCCYKFVKGKYFWRCKTRKLNKPI